MPVAGAYSFGGRVPARPPPGTLPLLCHFHDLQDEGRKSTQDEQGNAHVTKRHDFVSFEAGRITGEEPLPHQPRTRRAVWMALQFRPYIAKRALFRSMVIPGGVARI